MGKEGGGMRNGQNFVQVKKKSGKSILSKQSWTGVSRIGSAMDQLHLVDVFVHM